MRPGTDGEVDMMGRETEMGHDRIKNQGERQLVDHGGSWPSVVGVDYGQRDVRTTSGGRRRCGMRG